MTSDVSRHRVTRSTLRAVSLVILSRARSRAYPVTGPWYERRRRGHHLSGMAPGPPSVLASNASGRDRGGPMERTKIDGLELAYDLRGTGDPVVLVHWGVSARWAEPFWHEPALAEHFQLVTYHRAGFGESDRVKDGISVADHAAHCRLLMSRLGVE